MSTVSFPNRVLAVWHQRGWKGLVHALGRKVWRGSLWRNYSREAMLLASNLDFSRDDVEASRAIVERHREVSTIQSITWFLPDFSNPFYGGLHTILRFAAYLKSHKGVASQFVIVGTMPKNRVDQLITRAFPELAGTQVQAVQTYEQLAQVPPTDAAIATLWNTAYFLLRYNATKRKFYFLQDYEPIFYPAGSTYAQVEATYRFGYYGLANTPSIQKIYEQQYGGQAECFMPAVDTRIFHPNADPARTQRDPSTVFFYGRPEHPRNGFELGSAAMVKLKKRLGNRVRIVAAGATWHPGDFGLKGIVENLGILSYEQTAELYRNCQAGLTMMFTRHPSYLPLELMASGCVVVSNHNAATAWLLKDRENCLLSEASGSCLAQALEHALLDEAERARITTAAARLIQEQYSSWEAQIEKIYRYMCQPRPVVRNNQAVGEASLLGSAGRLI